ncbi:MAG: isoaspartyl peptidase/L-asparaginase, partial [Myxococcales bacterium]
YADDELGAASATGAGEDILRVLLCRHAVELLREHPPMDAARLAIAHLQRRTRSEAGVIVVSRSGEVGVAWNTQKMCRAFRAPDGTLRAET